MKFAAVALVLLASLTDGMAAAPACVEMRVVDDRPVADSIASSGTDDVTASPDGAHCGFGMVAIDGSDVGPREVLAVRIGGHATISFCGGTAWAIVQLLMVESQTGARSFSPEPKLNRTWRCEVGFPHSVSYVSARCKTMVGPAEVNQFNKVSDLAPW